MNLFVVVFTIGFVLASFIAFKLFERKERERCEEREQLEAALRKLESERGDAERRLKEATQIALAAKKTANAAKRKPEPIVSSSKQRSTLGTQSARASATESDTTEEDLDSASARLSSVSGAGSAIGAGYRSSSVFATPPQRLSSASQSSGIFDTEHEYLPLAAQPDRSRHSNADSSCDESRVSGASSAMVSSQTDSCSRKECIVVHTKARQYRQRLTDIERTLSSERSQYSRLRDALQSSVKEKGSADAARAKELLIEKTKESCDEDGDGNALRALRDLLVELFERFDAQKSTVQSLLSEARGETARVRQDYKQAVVRAEDAERALSDAKRRAERADADLKQARQQLSTLKATAADAAGTHDAKIAKLNSALGIAEKSKEHAEKELSAAVKARDLKEALLAAANTKLAELAGAQVSSSPSQRADTTKSDMQSDDAPSHADLLAKIAALHKAAEEKEALLAEQLATVHRLETKLRDSSRQLTPNSPRSSRQERGRKGSSSSSSPGAHDTSPARASVDDKSHGIVVKDLHATSTSPRSADEQVRLLQESIGNLERENNAMRGKHAMALSAASRAATQARDEAAKLAEQLSEAKKERARLRVERDELADALEKAEKSATDDGTADARVTDDDKAIAAAAAAATAVEASNTVRELRQNLEEMSGELVMLRQRSMFVDALKDELEAMRQRHKVELEEARRASASSNAGLRTTTTDTGVSGAPPPRAQQMLNASTPSLSNVSRSARSTFTKIRSSFKRQPSNTAIASSSASTASSKDSKSSQKLSTSQSEKRSPLLSKLSPRGRDRRISDTKTAAAPMAERSDEDAGATLNVANAHVGKADSPANLSTPPQTPPRGKQENRVGVLARPTSPARALANSKHLSLHVQRGDTDDSSQLRSLKAAWRSNWEGAALDDETRERRRHLLVQLQSGVRRWLARRSYAMWQQRAKVVRELIDTERNYVGYLDQLVNQYLHPLANGSGDAEGVNLSAEELSLLFSNVEVLFLCHRSVLYRFQSALRAVKRVAARVSVGGILLEACQAFSCYHFYVNSYPDGLEQLHRLLGANKPFARFCSKLANADVQHHDLADLLIQPVQRLPRYCMLVRELLKCTPPEDSDAAELARALRNLETLVLSVNEGARQHEAMRELAPRLIGWSDVPSDMRSQLHRAVHSLRSSLTGSSSAVSSPRLSTSSREHSRNFHHKEATQFLHPSRRLVQDGMLRDCDKKLRIAYLFSDHLMLAKMKGKKVKVKAAVPLYCTSVCEQSAEDACAFRIDGTVLYAATPDEALDWVAAVRSTIVGFASLMALLDTVGEVASDDDDDHVRDMLVPVVTPLEAGLVEAPLSDDEEGVFASGSTTGEHSGGAGTAVVRGEAIDNATASTSTTTTVPDTHDDPEERSKETDESAEAAVAQANNRGAGDGSGSGSAPKSVGGSVSWGSVRTAPTNIVQLKDDAHSRHSVASMGVWANASALRKEEKTRQSIAVGHADSMAAARHSLFHGSVLQSDSTYDLDDEDDGDEVGDDEEGSDEEFGDGEVVDSDSYGFEDEDDGSEESSDLDAPPPPPPEN